MRVEHRVVLRSARERLFVRGGLIGGGAVCGSWWAEPGMAGVFRGEARVADTISRLRQGGGKNVVSWCA